MNVLNNPLHKMLFALLLLKSPLLYAKFGCIQAEEGYVNLSASSALDSAVIQQLKNNEIVSCQMQEKQAQLCLIGSPNLKQNGYIYKHQINFFKGFKTLQLTQYSPLRVIYKNKDILVEVTAIATKQDNHLYGQVDEQGEQRYKYYKGKTFFGTDGDIPPPGFLQLAQIKIRYKTHLLQLNANQIEFYFFPYGGLGDQQNELADFKIFYLNDDVYILNTFNQGGIGGYNLLIQIHNGKIVKQQAWREEI